MSVTLRAECTPPWRLETPQSTFHNIIKPFLVRRRVRPHRRNFCFFTSFLLYLEIGDRPPTTPNFTEYLAHGWPATTRRRLSSGFFGEPDLYRSRDPVPSSLPSALFSRARARPARQAEGSASGSHNPSLLLLFRGPRGKYRPHRLHRRGPEDRPEAAELRGGTGGTLEVGSGIALGFGFCGGFGSVATA